MSTHLLGTSLAARRDSLDAHLERVLEDWRIPGASVSVAKDGEILFAKGYGLLELGQPERVDEHTVFGTGSVSKTFTAAAIALLIDRGLICWDDRVIDHLPSFRLADPWITANLTIRDILSHRVGLDQWENNFPWTFGALTRKEFVLRLRHLAPRERFRDCFAYSNALFNVLGEMLEPITGQSWEEFVTKEIFKPLGMSRTVSGHDKLVDGAHLAPYWGGRAPDGALKGRKGLLPRVSNVAVPHGPDASGEQVVYPWHHQEVTAAATNVASSAHDMALYMMAHLGATNFLKPTTVKELFSPQNLRAREGMNAVGLGWFIFDEDGTRVLRHAGGQVGYTSLTSLVPAENMGVTVLLNEDFSSGKSRTAQSLMSSAVMNAVRGLPFGAAQQQSLESSPVRKGAVEQEVVMQRSRSAERKVAFALSLDRYAGRFVHSANGDLDIAVSENRLIFRFAPLVSGDLIHEAGETFRLRFDSEHFHDHNLVLSFTNMLEAQPESLVLTGLPTLSGYQSSTSWTYHRS